MTSSLDATDSARSIYGWQPVLSSAEAASARCGETNGPRWVADATLASGAAGVALVLLAAVEDREPRWQSLFLL